MQTAIFCLAFPVIGLLIWRHYQEDKPISGRELLFRYVIYTLAANLITCFILIFFNEEGTSFQAKMDASPIFALKFAILELVAVLFVTGLEWMYVTRRLTIKVHWQQYREMGLGKFVEKVLFPCGIYLTAAVVIFLNVSLMFDNVLWGDECFSANTAQKSAEGILQVLYFWDSHPPLYYYWLKLFGDLFGHTGPIYHLASLVPFFIGIVLALTLFRRRFGNIPAAFIIVITGLGSSCLQYNVEIRMYSLAFLSVACCYYCAYRVLCGGRLAWSGMVLWALIGAYSHYYAMMTAGILIFVTGAAAAIRFRGKTWIKGLLALLAYIAGYSPWLGFLFRTTQSVSNSWWVSEIMGLQNSLEMVLFGPEFQKIVLCLLILFLAVLLLSESSFFRIQKQDDNTEIAICAPRLTNWSDETYGAAVGALTVAGTLIAAYTLCLIVGPVLVQRYLYPVSAITVLLLVIGAKGSLDIIKRLCDKLKRKWPEHLAKCVLVLALAALCVIGVSNYRSFRSQVKAEQAATEQTLNLIGEVSEDTVFVNNNVKHLSWTVLYYYYPNNEIITARCSDGDVTYDKFWYFTPEMLDSETLQTMQDKGYSAGYYGTCQIATYTFELYSFEK